MSTGGKYKGGGPPKAKYRQARQILNAPKGSQDLPVKVELALHLVNTADNTPAGALPTRVFLDLEPGVDVTTDSDGRVLFEAQITEARPHSILVQEMDTNMMFGPFDFVIEAKKKPEPAKLDRAVYIHPVTKALGNGRYKVILTAGLKEKGGDPVKDVVINLERPGTWEALRPTDDKGKIETDAEVPVGETEYNPRYFAEGYNNPESQGALLLFRY